MTTPPIDPKTNEPILTSLAAEIPPLELDHTAALKLYLEHDPRTQSEPDFNAMVIHYREQRRQQAAKILERELKRKAAAEKKALATAKRLAREAKSATPTKSGGEGSEIKSEATETGSST
jgi:hypothetical protein